MGQSDGKESLPAARRRQARQGPWVPPAQCPWPHPGFSWGLYCLPCVPWAWASVSGFLETEVVVKGGPEPAGMDAHPSLRAVETTCSGARRGAAAGAHRGWKPWAQLGLWEGWRGLWGKGLTGAGSSAETPGPPPRFGKNRTWGASFCPPLGPPPPRLSPTCSLPSPAPLLLLSVLPSSCG